MVMEAIAAASQEISTTDALAPQNPVLISAGARAIDLISIFVPLGAFVAALVLLWGRGLGWMQLGVMAAMYLVTGFGVTVGFHRLFTHKSFVAPRLVRVALAVMGSMSVQGPLLWWVAMHRQHHQHSDGPGDPHSPHLHGKGLTGWLSGAWHAHMGWLFKEDGPGLARYVPDLLKEPALRAVNRLYPLWVLIGLVLPAAVGGGLTRTWLGALLGFLWGGLARIFLVHHVTWSVNSICHFWGARPFDTHDQSRNNLVFGVLALGEGWHNNHHAFPTSARHGLRWWQFDASYWVIRGMERLGLASKVRVPATQALAVRRT
jgi:stearoyl-CoA desaturase (delta-9 desaturase)